MSEGVNILECSFTSNSTDRFSEYIVESQQDGQGIAQHTVRATAYDQAVKRFRATIITAESGVDSTYAQQRAKWEAQARASKAQTVKLTVQGWRDPTGAVWAVNQIVTVNYPTCRIYNAQLLLTEVEFTKSEQGTQTTLTLKRSDIFTDETQLQATQDLVVAHKAATKAQKAAASKGKKYSKS